MNPRNLTVPDHPLIQHKLTLLRDRRTPAKVFKELVEELSTLMVHEVLRDAPTVEVEVETPLESTTGRRIREDEVALVPILRAGLGMVRGAELLLPESPIGHIGLTRDEDTLEPRLYYFKMPPADQIRSVLLLDPMLATGGTAVQAVDALKEHGSTRIRLVCLVAAPEGVERVGRAHPDVHVWAASLDRELSDEGWVVPGLGDAGDRLFGTR